jgi:hypothetical protein
MRQWHRRVVMKDIVFLTTHPYIAFLANPSKYNIHGISIAIQWFECWKPLNSKQMPDFSFLLRRSGAFPIVTRAS